MTPEQLWKEFCIHNKVNSNEKYEAWAFGGGKSFEDSLLKLVLEGKKFGTASLYEYYLKEEEDIPHERDYSILLDSKENAVCVIRNFDVRVAPFYRVSEYHGYSEGEENRNLDSWRTIHEKFFGDDFEYLGIKNVKDCHAVLEKFTLEYVASDYKGAYTLSPELFLVEPTKRYSDQIKEYRRIMLEANSSMDGCLGLPKMENPDEFVDYAYEWGNPARENNDHEIRGTQLLCIRKSDDRLVGMIQVRSINPNHPMAFVGNIGYSVLPNERGQGYAKEMLRQALVYLKYGLNEKKAILASRPDNIASIKVILNQGGIHKDTINVKERDIVLNRYEIDLEGL